VEQFADSFKLAEAPQSIVAQLIEREQEFAHLGLARLACVFSERELWLHGGQKAAIIATPAYVQGPLRHLLTWLVAGLVAPLFEWEEPDFLILVDRALWDTLDPERRERLVYHELCHVQARETEFGTPRLGQDGRPMLKLVPHDAEAFHAEIERYGVEICGLEDTAIAIATGERHRRTRDKAIA
jgi:hypothetical protein